MNKVNEHLFGFSYIENYEELLKLLIEIRSPKLSKEFKPTKIYTILNNSQKTLSEDDLRPMAEAMDNMDSLNMKLIALEKSLKAAESLKKSYHNYNKYILFLKAKDYLEKETYISNLAKEREKLLHSIEELKNKKDIREKEAEALKGKYDKARVEYEELIKDDIFSTKNELENLKREIDEEEKEERERKKEEFFKELILINKGIRAELWLEEILKNKSFGYSMISKNYEAYYKENKINEFKVFLDYILKGFNSLTFNTNDSENLPIFSSKTTKDPHYFDVDKPAGKILIHGICFELKREYPRDVEETAELLYSAGILKDDVSSSIAAYGLKAYKKNYELDFIYSFTKFGEPLTFTLGNLSKIDKFLCNKNRLFIFENPSLFSEVIKRIGKLNPSIICTSGQLKLASLILLDKLIEGVEEIYYSGDFDPEGISIANKLKIRYGDKLKFWRFDVEDYLKIISHKKISSISKAKLDNIENDELSPLIEKIKEKGLAGYQELLIEDYIDDINSLQKE